LASPPIVFTEQGATSMPIVRNEPLESDAPMSFSLYTTSASAATSEAEKSVSATIVCFAAEVSTRCVSMPPAARSACSARIP
jgi:hypothetical protein